MSLSPSDWCHSSISSISIRRRIIRKLPPQKEVRRSTMHQMNKEEKGIDYHDEFGGGGQEVVQQPVEGSGGVIVIIIMDSCRLQPRMGVQPSLRVHPGGNDGGCRRWTGREEERELVLQQLEAFVPAQFQFQWWGGFVFGTFAFAGCVSLLQLGQ